ncbi:hypothetical protein [Streptacidiphilus sp. EB103A]|uniref:hypothetical protein n=1 Tax=Streptacidiphilus sp. EB103A TaxID=3156275 RepID=UPI0035130DDF
MSTTEERGVRLLELGVTEALTDLEKTADPFDLVLESHTPAAAITAHGTRRIRGNAVLWSPPDLHRRRTPQITGFRPTPRVR